MQQKAWIAAAEKPLSAAANAAEKERRIANTAGRRRQARQSDEEEARKMENARQGMTWKEIAGELIKEFIAWGCPYNRKKLPEIALGYDLSLIHI